MAEAGAAIRVFCAIVFGLCSGVSARAQATPPSPEVRIASEGARPPYNYLDNNELAGFEIDLGRDLCRRMDARCSFVPRDWDSLVPDLLSGQFDAIMAAIEITDARRERIAFSAPYVRMPSSFLVTRDSELKAADPEALAGKTLGVEAGGMHEAFLDEAYKGSTIKPYATLEDAILDLANERIDAAIGDKDAIVDFLKTRKEGQCCRLLGDVERDPGFFGEGIAIGLRKGDASLKAAFDKALRESEADGTFATIAKRYFDFPIN